jgi:acyl-coenzyme A thioesterase PaaI-like protein
MATNRSSPGERVRTLWRRLAPLPGGRWLFSRLLGMTAPYSGSIGATVLELAPGYCRVRLRDRRAVRNHLSSVHALALANVAELASGLAMTVALPATARGIVTQLGIRYLRKARGTLIAECRCELPDVSVDGEHDFAASVFDAGGAEVARATVTWRLGPVNEARP